MKSQILDFGKDSLIYGLGTVITRFVGLFTLPLFTTYLTPEEYGVLAMLGMLALFAHPIFSLGLSGAIGLCYFENDDVKNKSTVIWTAFLIHAVSSLFLISIAWIYPEPIAKLINLPAENIHLIGLSLTGCAFTILVTAISARVQFEKQAKLYVFVTVFTALTTILASIVTVVFFDWGLKGMVLSQLLGNAITLLMFIFLAMQNTRLSLDIFTAKELIGHGLPLLPSFVFLFIIMHGNKYILEWNSGLDSVGLYSIGFNLGMTISIVTGGISTAWFPYFLQYTNRQSEVKEIFSRIFTYYVFGVGLIVLFYFIFAELIIKILTHEAFHSAYHLIGFIAIANFSQTLFGFFLPGLYFNKEVNYVSVVQGLTALISIPLNYYLIVKLDALGAAVGLAISNVLMAALMFNWNLLRKSRYPRINYEWHRIATFFVVACLISVINEQFVVHTIFNQTLKSILMAVMATVVTFLLLNSSEKKFLLTRFRLLSEHKNEIL